MGQRVWALAIALVAAVTLGVPAPADARSGPLVITYEVRGRGNVSPLEDLAAEAAAVYADPRGWNLGGSIQFARVATGGAFTLWLASDDQMSTFGGACGPVWSCRNGRNVVINEARWLASSDSWLTAAAPLATYRQMVINHETGHWLGFGHASCPAPGALAPVMQQQSMGLSGCVPNPWPLPSERSVLAANRGQPIVAPGDPADPPSTTTTTAGPSVPGTGAPVTTPTRTGVVPSPGPPVTTTTTSRSAPTSRRGAVCRDLVPLAAPRFWMTCFWPS
jgi:hypothetical protein